MSNDSMCTEVEDRTSAYKTEKSHSSVFSQMKAESGIYVVGVILTTIWAITFLGLYFGGWARQDGTVSYFLNVRQLSIILFIVDSLYLIAQYSV